MTTVAWPKDLRHGIPGVSERMHTMSAWALVRALAGVGLTDEQLQRVVATAEQMHDRKPVGDRTRGPWMRPEDYYRALAELRGTGEWVAWKLRGLRIEEES